MNRPSGASLCVVKTFFTREERNMQLMLMNGAPGLMLEAAPGADFEIVMPLADRRVRRRDFVQVFELLARLWNVESPRPKCGRAVYQAYVSERELPESFGSDRDVRLLFAKAHATCDDLFEELALCPFEQNAFVHGDATLSNFVTTRQGLRLIDPSPRPSPPEIELDLAKLRFSALGFDLGPRRALVLRALLNKAESSLGAHPVLLRYYLATHVVRVMSREPPFGAAREDRLAFFERVLQHVERG